MSGQESQFREEALTAMVAALGEMVDEHGMWYATKGGTAAELAKLSGVNAETARRMMRTLQSLGIFEGPVRMRSIVFCGNGYQNWQWRLLRPGAVISKDEQGFYVATDPAQE